MIRLWRRSTLRSQLVATIALLLVASLAILGTTVSALAQSSLIDQMDAQLRILSSNLYQTGISTTAPSSVGSGLYTRLSRADGSMVSEQTAGSSPPKFPDMTLAQAMEHSSGPVNLRDAGDSGLWRAQIVAPVLLKTADPEKPSEEGYVLVAISYQSFNKSVFKLTAVMIAVIVITGALGIIAAYLAVTRSFRPLRRVERTAAAIIDGDLSQRVRVNNTASEVGKLAVALNTMLSHIEKSFAARKASEERMRQFIADASHELRTPLVTIRGYSELYRQGALRSEEDVTTAVGRIESEAKRMGALVEDLLLLARIDEKRPLDLSLVNLLIIGNDAAVDARAASPDRRITVVGLDDSAAPTAAWVYADESKIRQVSSNLITNALRYTPAGSPVEIAVGTFTDGDASYSVLSVTDHGPGIPEDEASRIFERFYRAEASRNRTTGGSGLGLAIVAAIVAAQHGTVRYHPTPGGGTTMRVTLPSAAAEPEDGAPEVIDEPEASAGRSSLAEHQLPQTR